MHGGITCTGVCHALQGFPPPRTHSGPHPALPRAASTPALVTLVDILSAIPAHPRVGRDRGAASRALQGLCGGLIVLIEVSKLNHQVGGHNGQWEVDLHLGLAWGELRLLGSVPPGRPGQVGRERRGNKQQSKTRGPHIPSLLAPAKGCCLH